MLLGPVLDIDSGGGGGGLLRPPGSSVIRQSPLGLRKISTTYLVDFKTQISTFLKNKYIKNVLIFQIKYLFEFKIYLFFKKVLIRSILNRNLVPFCDFCDFCDFYTYDQRMYLFEILISGFWVLREWPSTFGHAVLLGTPNEVGLHIIQRRN